MFVLEPFARHTIAWLPPRLITRCLPIWVWAAWMICSLSVSASSTSGTPRGVRIDGAVVSDKGLKVEAGTCVVQVGKRKFAKVTLA